MNIGNGLRNTSLSFIIGDMKRAVTGYPAPSVHLPDLLSFEVVARHMNFARAAAEMTVTPTVMSKTIKVLESQLGVRLFSRTTRSVALTEEDEAVLLCRLAPALTQIRSSIEQANISSSRPLGLVRINTSYVAYTALVEPHMNAFLDRHPEISLDVQIVNGLSDIVAGGFDAGIRRATPCIAT